MKQGDQDRISLLWLTATEGSLTSFKHPVQALCSLWLEALHQRLSELRDKQRRERSSDRPATPPTSR